MTSLFSRPAAKIGGIAVAAAATVAITTVALLPNGNGVTTANGSAYIPPVSTSTPTAPASNRTNSSGISSANSSTGSSTGSSTMSNRPSATGTVPHTITLAGAQLTLPSGWHATELKNMVTEPAWCLHPAGTDVSDSNDCPIIFASADGAAQTLDADIEGGIESNPQWCSAGSDWTSTGSAGVADFGGREAEHRRWNYNCPNGSSYHIEQYEVVTSPSYLLYSQHAEGETAGILHKLASTAELPAQQLPIRLFDRGVIRSVKKTGKTEKITIDRVYINPASRGKRYINNSSRTYTYQAPASLGGKVGLVIALNTDGHQVVATHGD